MTDVMDAVQGRNVRPIRLAAVGDMMLGDSAICTGYGFASRYADPESLKRITALRRFWTSTDLVFGNLECSLSNIRHSRRRWRSTQLRGQPDFARVLREAGIDVLNVANNHASQHGDDAFADTVALVTSAGIVCCGVRGTGQWCSEPAEVTVRDRRIGFLGYCLRPRQYSPAIPPYAEGSHREIVDDVSRLRSSVEHVIVSLHWGEEFVDQPSVDEVSLAHDIVDAGASVILGHHPHVPRPVELYGTSVIAYSLGNFLSDMIWYPPLRKPLMLTLELDDTPQRVGATLLTIDDSFLPVEDDVDEGIVSTSITGMLNTEYATAVDRTVSEFRTASYLHAAQNVHRFRFPTQFALLGVTARNKLAALFSVITGKRVRG
jgi:poly-gamma-glutamate synthesis protein (capsule biosynthesis protein)